MDCACEQQREGRNESHSVQIKRQASTGMMNVMGLEFLSRVRAER